MPETPSEITLTLLHPTSGTPLQSWTFRENTVIRIGRAADNEVSIRSEVVSRYHAELRRRDSQVVLVGLGTNGTFVDGTRITETPLADGQSFVLAPTGPTIRFHVGAAKAEDRMEQTMHIKFMPMMGIAVDEKKKATQVAEITESDYFQRLQTKLGALRGNKTDTNE